MSEPGLNRLKWISTVIFICPEKATGGPLVCVGLLSTLYCSFAECHVHITYHGHHRKPLVAVPNTYFRLTPSTLLQFFGLARATPTQPGHSPVLAIFRRFLRGVSILAILPCALVPSEKSVETLTSTQHLVNEQMLSHVGSRPVHRMGKITKCSAFIR